MQEVRSSSLRSSTRSSAYFECSAGDRFCPSGAFEGQVCGQPVRRRLADLRRRRGWPGSQRRAVSAIMKLSSEGRAAYYSGPAVSAHLTVGRNDVHAFPRRLQWKLPGRCGDGWHRHRHRPGLNLRHDTTNEGWGLLTGHQRGPRPGHIRGLSRLWPTFRDGPGSGVSGGGLIIIFVIMPGVRS